MTVSELRAKLDEFPDYMEVCFRVDDDEYYPHDIYDVSTEQRTTGVILPRPTTRTVLVLS